MALGTALALGGAALGGLAGAIPQEKRSESGSVSSVDLMGPSNFENATLSSSANSYNTLQNLANLGPGASDVSASVDASRDLAEMLRQYSQGGNLPSQSDVSNANFFASNIFSPQEVALRQSFADQTTEANRRAALMGSSLNDPILAAKLAQEQTRQSSLLSAQRGSFAQQLALQMPGQRLSYASDRANLLGGLASQAMSNRQALLSMGSQLLGNERNWRYNISNKQTNSWGKEQGGGGLAGAITGALGGAGMGLNFAGVLNAPSFAAGGGVPNMSQQFSGVSNFNYSQAANSMFGVSSGRSLMENLYE